MEAFQTREAFDPMIVISIMVVLASALFFRLQRQRSRSRDPNLPPIVTDIGFKDTGKLFMAPTAPRDMLRLARRVGSKVFEVPLLPGRIVSFFIITDYKAARKALEDVKSTKFEPTNLFFFRTTNNGPNIVVAEGHRWKHVRKNTSSAFSPVNIKKMIPPIDCILDNWIKDVLEPSIESNTSIDVLDEMNNITANVIADVAFDYEFAPGEREQFLFDLSTCWQVFGAEAGSNIFMQIKYTYLLYPSIWRAKFAAKRMYNFCEKMMNDYRKKVGTKRQEHKLIDMILHDDEYANDGERYRDMIAYVIAGFDTTANTLSFALRELARCPEEQMKLRKALQACKSPDEARNSPQLKMVLKEIIRMFPAAALGSVRQLGRDLVLPSGNIIPKGSIVNTNYYCIQRDEELFENPDSFHPSRWENPTPEQTMSIMTFSLGRRSCQGQGLANVEMNEILYRLVTKYSFEIDIEGIEANVILFKPVGTRLLVKCV